MPGRTSVGGRHLEGRAGGLHKFTAPRRVRTNALVEASQSAQTVACWHVLAQSKRVLDVRTGRGQTAMHLAASVGNLAMVQRLLEFGAGALPRFLRIAGERCFGGCASFVNLSSPF